MTYGDIIIIFIIIFFITKLTDATQYKHWKASDTNKRS